MIPYTKLRYSNHDEVHKIWHHAVVSNFELKKPNMLPYRIPKGSIAAHLLFFSSVLANPPGGLLF